MTFSFPSAAALLLAASLCACGGKAEFVVGGTIHNLTDPDLVINNNGTLITVANPNYNATDAAKPIPVLDVAPDFAFSFPTSISYGTGYNVTVNTPVDPTPIPNNPTFVPRHHQVCTPVNGVDTAGRLTTINIFISCAAPTHLLSGIVVGLTVGDTAVDANGNLHTVSITNGSGNAVVVPLAAATAGSTVTDVPFALPGLTYGTPYGLSLLPTPGYSCAILQPSDTLPSGPTTAVGPTIGAPVGVMPDSDITNLVIKCTPL